MAILNPGQKIRVETVDWPSLTTQPTTADPAIIKEAITVYQGASLAFKTGLLQELNLSNDSPNTHHLND
ncbi:MAG: hypothetical protein IAF00_10500 [Phycisphaerales bacterium]|nr:hypothetical protein [Phycisphaerales bacterium]